jgi:biopolymer transport protein ExbB
MELTTIESLGFAHFLTHTDTVGRLVLGILLLLSVASWYLIVTRALANSLAQRRSDAFLQRFWQARSLAEVQQMGASQAPDNPAANLVHKALEALGNGNQQSLALAGGLGEYLTRTLNNAVDQEAADSEYGLTVLATAGSAAPYVGLFGTVWGIYHALVQIGMSGQGTLDKVAGPVGEALIMTALGLAVAIPAVLAYNAFNRRNRVWLARLESFSHDLYVLLTVKSGESGDSRGNGSSSNSNAGRA